MRPVTACDVPTKLWLWFCVVPGLFPCSATLRGFGRSASIPDYSRLLTSVVRVLVREPSFSWLHPYAFSVDSLTSGTAFVVQLDPYPLFVTNAHVIQDATKITVQVLAHSEYPWDVDVVQTCPHFDNALLALRQPDAFMRAMADGGIKIQALRLTESAVSMGKDVIAVGYPRIQNSLKISKGTVAGNQAVDGNICIQSTAPISLGCGGGPLVSAANSEVLGVNFAMSTSGENIYYVVPAWRVAQLVRQHLKEQPVVPSQGSWQRIRFDPPPMELTTVPPNDALYTLRGCSAGIYISKIGRRSLFRTSVPPVIEGSFLISVRGRSVDSFGMGFDPNYMADRVDYPDLFFMAHDIADDVDFQTCHQGNITKHTVSLVHKPEYDLGINFVDEPVIQNWTKAYETFGGVSVMQMTLNHINVFRKANLYGPSRWLHPDDIFQPRLIINDLETGSYASNVLSIGAAVDMVNGHQVRTLEEFRNHFSPQDGPVWTLTTDRGQICAFMYEETLTKQLDRASYAPHLLTPGVARAAQEAGLLEGDAGDGPAAFAAGLADAFGSRSMRLM